MSGVVRVQQMITDQTFTGAGEFFSEPIELGDIYSWALQANFVVDAAITAVAVVLQASIDDVNYADIDRFSRDARANNDIIWHSEGSTFTSLRIKLTLAGTGDVLLNATLARMTAS